MTKEEIIEEIRVAFKDVRLEDGVGLWEGQGLDDRADIQALLELRKKDERNDWNNITDKDLASCESSLYFLDAKGTRFCIPKFLIADIIKKDPGVLLVIDLQHYFNNERDDHQGKFSLFNGRQIQCIIYYLEYRMDEMIEEYKEYSVEYGSVADAVFSDPSYKELSNTVRTWKQKLIEFE